MELRENMDLYPYGTVLKLSPGDRCLLKSGSLTLKLAVLPQGTLRILPINGGIKTGSRIVPKLGSIQIRYTGENGSPDLLDRRVSTTLLEIEPLGFKTDVKLLKDLAEKRGSSPLRKRKTE